MLNSVLEVVLREQRSFCRPSDGTQKLAEKISRFANAFFCLLKCVGETKQNTGVGNQATGDLGRLKFQIFRGQVSEVVLEEVANLRINVFSEYPYLYQGTMESEKLYLKHYLSQSNIILVLIKLDNQTIGAVLGSPLEGMGEKYVTPFLNKGLCVNTIYYLGDIILKKEYRGKGLGGQLYAQFEAVLNDLGGYKNLTICEIATSEDDPLRPI